MNPLTKTLLPLILLIWSIPTLAQQTEDFTTAYNWVEMPDQNPLPPPAVSEGFGAAPQLIDFDGDGDLDAFDSIYYYENLGTANQPKFKTPPTKITDQFFDGAEIDGHFRFADIDNDNDWDVFVTPIEEGISIKYYENTGQKNAPAYEERTGTANPLANVQVGDDKENDDIRPGAILSFVDLDGDQDLDSFFGSQYDRPMPYYKNIGNSNHPQFEKQTDSTSNPLNGLYVDYVFYDMPHFVDYDQDGDLDVFITSGGSDYYENTGTAKQPQFEKRSANPLNEQIIGPSKSNIYPLDLKDLDNDNDLDVVKSRANLPLTYYENTGSIHSPQFVEHELFKEPNTVDVETSQHHHPSFVDIDNDGDQDAFIEWDYYENIGNARIPQFVERTNTANPLHDLPNDPVNPVFVDIDGDGDWDFIGDNGHFYENIGTASHPQFVEKLENLLGDMNVASHSFSVVDIDHDRDMDIFILSKSTQNSVRYIENVGNINTPVFVEYSGNANPLDGIQTFGSSSTILNFYDMDHDGDWDALLADSNFLNYYENTGSSRFPVFEQRSGQNNPFLTLKPFAEQENRSFYIFPQFVDIDNDGHLEGFVGWRDGTVKYYQNAIQPPNNNNPYVFKKSLDNPLAHLPAHTYSEWIGFANIDNDDDWDLFTMDPLYNENIGDSNNPRFIDDSVDDVIQKINALNVDSVIVVDLDQDENLEVLMYGAAGSELLYFENVGTSNHPHFEESVTNPFKVIKKGSGGPHTTSHFDFVDIDNDQDLDLFVISGIVLNGWEIRYFENIGHAHSPIFEERFETANPLGEFGDPNIRILCPRFIDIDNDGDWDAFTLFFDLSNSDYGTRYFENIGDINQPQFEERTNTANPFAEMELKPNQKPALADLDLDGDWDILTGMADGTLRYYENMGSMTTPQFVEHVDHPLDWVRMGHQSIPRFADFDQDGDWDIFVGDTFWDIRYYENTGNATQPVFQPPRFNNPLPGVSTKGYFNVVDIDNDMDQDLFIRSHSDDNVWGIIRYHENVGDINAPKFVERTEPTLTGQIATFVDLDNDQDWDAFAWYYYGGDSKIRYYENVGQVDQPQFVERLGIANPLEKINPKIRDLQFMDRDSDGDWDMVMVEGEIQKKLSYYENIGQPDNPTFIKNNTANPFKNFNSSNLDKLLIDMDKDGDMDVFIRNNQITEYYVNTSVKGHILANHYALPSGGKYNQGREITLGCLDCSKIYYTLDGSQPTTESPVFTAPFNVTETTTLKFFTKDAQGNASEVTTEKYLIDTQPPVLNITWPFNNQVLLKIETIEGTFEDPEGSSEIGRIELQINSGPLYLTGNKNDPFTSSPVWIKFLPTSRHKWYHEFGNLLPVGPYTIRARAYDFAGNFAEETLTVIKVELALSDLFLELDSATLLNDATLNVKGSLVSRRYPSIQENIAGLPIELTITAPDGSTRTETTEILSDIGQYEFNDLSDFTLEGTYTLQTHFAGNRILTGSVSSQQTVLVGESAGYAIIIQGKIENEEGLKSHNKSTNRIYQVLKQRGFEDANIFYFNTNPDQEGIEIDGEPTVADFVTIEELQNRINGSPAPFYLIMVNHGDPDGNFYLNDVDLEFVTPQIWADWLNALEAGLIDQSKPRIIMLGYCFSGKTLEALSKPGRIVVSSATAKEESYKGPTEPDGIRGGEYFMDDFFKNLGRGESFREAFEKSSEKTRQFTTRGGRFINIENEFGDDAVQHPLIDANGDKKGSNDIKLEASPAEPMYNLSELFLGAGADYDTNYAGNPADILKVAETIYLTPEQSAAELSLTVNEVLRIKEATVNVRLPSTELELADTKRTGYAEQREIAELVEINLLCDFSQQCVRNTDEVSPDLFADPGKYDLFYFVVDNETDNMSPIHRAVVYKNKPGNQPPAEFSLLTPANAAKTETTITFTWQPSTDPDGDPITYSLVISEDYDFHTIIYQNDGLRKPEFALEDNMVLEANTTYYWKVEAMDYFGEKVESGEVFLLSTE